jgi:SAM-dependent methyltransferase/methyltransferase-like protein
MPTEQDAYDRVAYPCFAYPDTHPDRLATMALLHGLEPAPVERCRVLEIGCNEAANLIPMAYAIPGSEFVGFDLAGLPIARGQERIRELGLSNIRIFQADLMEVDERLGQFDYILAHGIYAWVPEPVRDRLLANCRALLAPEGVAFVSYNALPGGHLRNLVREILLHGAGDDDPAQSVARGLEFLRIVLESRPEGDPFRVLLDREAMQLEKRDPQVIYHDELCREHRAVSFSEFIAHAGSHGLRYLSESTLPAPTDPCFQPQQASTAETLAGGDRIAQEQILDFVRMRMYRETLLCRADHTISGDVCVEAFSRLRFGCAADSVPGEGAVLRVYTLPGGLRMKSQHPGTVQLMETLIDSWPRSIPFAELEERLAAHGIVFDAEFLTLLLRLVVSRFVQVHAWQAPVSSQIAVRPKASATSRQEAAMRDQVATLLHSSLQLEDAQVRNFLMLLDGTRDRSELLAALEERNPQMPEGALAERIEPNLRLLHRNGVLLAEDFD